jgi:hypothetical protein
LTGFSRVSIFPPQNPAFFPPVVSLTHKRDRNNGCTIVTKAVFDPQRVVGHGSRVGRRIECRPIPPRTGRSAQARYKRHRSPRGIRPRFAKQEPDLVRSPGPRVDRRLAHRQRPARRAMPSTPTAVIMGRACVGRKRIPASYRGRTRRAIPPRQRLEAPTPEDITRYFATARSIRSIIQSMPKPIAAWATARTTRFLMRVRSNSDDGMSRNATTKYRRAVIDVFGRLHYTNGTHGPASRRFLEIRSHLA